MSQILDYFRISIATNGQFYANGNQQVRVRIDIRKIDLNTGQRVPLSPEELASIRVVNRTDNLNETALPQGWVMTDTSNDFTKSLSPRASTVKNEEDVIPIVNIHDITEYQGVSCCSSNQSYMDDKVEVYNNNVPQEVFRYITATTILTRELMAAMTLILPDGTKVPYTTNMQNSNGHFNEFITLEAIPPLFIAARDLVVRELNFRHSNWIWTCGWYADQAITIRIWRLPNNIQIHRVEATEIPQLPSPVPQVSAANRRIFSVRQNRGWHDVLAENWTNVATFLAPGASTVDQDSFGARNTGGLRMCIRVLDERGNNFSYSFLQVANNEFGAALLDVQNCAHSNTPNNAGGSMRHVIIDQFGNRHSFNIINNQRGQLDIINT